MGCILWESRLGQCNDFFRVIESIRSYLDASFLRPAPEALEQVTVSTAGIQKGARAFDTICDWPAQDFPVLCAARGMEPEPRLLPGEGPCQVGCFKGLLLCFKPAGEFCVVHTSSVFCFIHGCLEKKGW